MCSTFRLLQETFGLPNRSGLVAATLYKMFVNNVVRRAGSAFVKGRRMMSGHGSDAEVEKEMAKWKNITKGTFLDHPRILRAWANELTIFTNSLI
jgi:hypothetical protein